MSDKTQATPNLIEWRVRSNAEYLGRLLVLLFGPDADKSDDADAD
jgi:hypothetical protein